MGQNPFFWATVMENRIKDKSLCPIPVAIARLCQILKIGRGKNVRSIMSKLTKLCEIVETDRVFFWRILNLFLHHYWVKFEITEQKKW